MDIHDLVQAQRAALAREDGILPVPTRIEALGKLTALIRAREGDILAALHSDLGKSAGEAYMTEVGMVLSEIAYTAKRLRAWARPKRVRTPLAQFPGKTRVYREPYGIALIMSPWNYPFQLTLTPLVSAFAAGNACVVKPSNYSPATAGVIAQLLASWQPKERVAGVTGGRAENQALLDERFDYIFFTGGATVGKLVLEKAAVHATPVTLELGGKSPCIVDETADIAIAGKRIAFGKGLNSGQTCVAPDYLLVHEAVKDALLAEIRKNWQAFYGADALACDHWPRMVSQKHYDRVMGLIAGENVYCGGIGKDGRIAPTLLDGVSWDAPVMREEIFGPVLPVIPFKNIDDVISRVNERDKPLALYLFSGNQATIDRVLARVPFGGGCVNDTIMHLASPRVPFGGVGLSGMGAYHGKHGFDTFTHEKTVLFSGTRPDVPLRYPPFTDQKLRLVRRFMK